MRIGSITYDATRAYPARDDRIIAPIHLSYYINENLIKRGYDVTLFASKDSKTKCNLVTNNLPSFDNQSPIENTAWSSSYIATQQNLLLLNAVTEEIQTKQYDIIHAHEFRLLPYFSPLIPLPIIVTYHGNPDDDFILDEDKLRMKKFFDKIYFVAISDNQIKQGSKSFNFIGRVYHGIDVKRFSFSLKTDDSLLHSGRLLPFKGPDKSINIALKLGKKITVIGQPQLNGIYDKYYHQEVEPLLKNKLVDYHGFIPYNSIERYYQKAKALLVPISWEEPFGLVMIEAMACGTPVIAFNRGSVSEIIEDGKTGFIIKNNNISQFTKMVKYLYQMPETQYEQMRRACRERVEKMFSIEKMVDGYEKMYQIAIDRWKKTNK